MIIVPIFLGFTPNKTPQRIFAAIGENFTFCRLTRYGVCFTAQVWPGDDLSASATVTAIDMVDGTPIAEFSLETKNQDGVVVLSGSAAARLDP